MTSGPLPGAVTSLREAVRDAVRTLEVAGVESAEYDAVALAASVLKTSTSEVHKLMIVGAPVASSSQRTSWRPSSV